MVTALVTVCQAANCGDVIADRMSTIQNVYTIVREQATTVHACMQCCIQGICVVFLQGCLGKTIGHFQGLFAGIFAIIFVTSYQTWYSTYIGYCCCFNLVTQHIPDYVTLPNSASCATESN